jgi:hypothetical protein
VAAPGQKTYFKRELQLAHSEGGSALEASAAGEISNLSEVRVRRRQAAASPVQVGASQRGMVEDVEPFKADLNGLPLPNRKFLMAEKSTFQTAGPVRL